MTGDDPRFINRDPIFDAVTEGGEADLTKVRRIIRNE
jgi:hypothetical protein